MRFVCDSCRAQYMISDDKIGPKGVKLRCKKCGHTILVRPAGAPAAKEGGADAAAAASAAAEAANANANTPRIVEPSNAGMPASLGTPPEGGLFTDVEEDEIGAVFDQVLSTGSQKLKAAEAEAEAKAAKAEAVRKLAEAESAEPSPEEKAAATAHEWYVAIDEKQVGPWSVEKVKDAWDRGEVGPDNLCWRSGFSDWIPLSETKELASVLAPRPAKPVIVAPAPVSTSSPTLPAGPVESAFSAGTSSRPNMPAASEEPVGWKPSAASVLASLVKEENDALSKPPPRPAPSLEREPVSQARLLDVPVPPPEPVSSPSMPGAMMNAGPAMAAAPTAFAPPQQGYAPPQQVPPGYAPQPPVAYPPQQAQMQYPPQQQGYPPPGYPAAYPPPPAAPTGGKGRTGMLVAVTAGVLVMAGAAVVFVARGNNAPERPVDPPAQVAVAQTPPPKVETPPAPPPAATQAPAAVAQTPPAATPPVATAAAPAEGTPATVAAGTPPATAPTAAGTPPATAPAAVATAPATPPAPPAAEVKPASATLPSSAVARAEPRNPRRSGSSSRGSSSHQEDEGDAIVASKPAASSSSSSSNSGGGDDDFDELFGTKKAQATAKPASKPTTTAYIPPEPGGGTPDRLQQSDIMQVVLNNKPAIMKCVGEQRQKDSSVTGKLVMRWTVQTSGKTTAVSCRTDEFKSSYMASCITGLIKGWTFPKHLKQGDPIDFPFTF